MSVDGNGCSTEIGRFRTILPQFLASTAKNFLLLDLGMTVAFPTIVIPALTGVGTLRDATEPLRLSNEQTSWFGSIAFICQPVGSILSGILLERFGRKRSMILVNIPHIIGWLIFYNATGIGELYAAAALLGLGVGFMEAPVITYVGEICQPSVRGILISYANIATTVGVLLVFLLGAFVTWRNIALLSVAVPLIAVVSICFVPETPYWLLARNRRDAALKSLQWLRGWVAPEAVAPEFNAMLHHCENFNKCGECNKARVRCGHSTVSFWTRMGEFKRGRTLKPFLLILTLFALSQFGGLSAMRPYLVQIFQAYRLPIAPIWGTVVVGVLGLLANILCMLLISFIGKRKLLLYSVSVSSVCCLALAFYGMNFLPAGLTSFNLLPTDYDVEENNPLLGNLAMALFFLLTFATNIGIVPIPWVLLSEVFPFKVRGMASGLAAALNYIMAFLATKTYYKLETNLTLAGIILLYGVIGIFGFLFVLFLVPETENHTLEDIELHFSSKTGKWTNVNISSNKTGDILSQAETG